MARKSKSIRVYVKDWLHFWVMFWYIQFHCLLGEEVTMSHRRELVAKMPEKRAGLCTCVCFTSGSIAFAGFVAQNKIKIADTAVGVAQIKLLNL